MASLTVARAVGSAFRTHPVRCANDKLKLLAQGLHTYAHYTPQRKIQKIKIQKRRFSVGCHPIGALLRGVLVVRLCCLRRVGQPLLLRLTRLGLLGRLL